MSSLASRAHVEPPPAPDPADLEGRAFDIRLDNGWRIHHAFVNGWITWEIVEGRGRGLSGSHPYRAVEMRPSLFFVDFTKGDAALTSNVSMIVDLVDGHVTVAESTIVAADGSVRMRTDILAGRIHGTGAITLPRDDENPTGSVSANRAQGWEIAKGLVLLHWRDDREPADSVVVLDLSRNFSVGRRFAWDSIARTGVHTAFTSAPTILDDEPSPSIP